MNLMARLLVVDDEPAICWGLARLGERLGHKVQTASTAEQALQHAEANGFDLVVLDIRLPGMDGLAAIEKLRPLLPAAPIIVMTAYGDLGTAVRVVRGGAFDYLVKPFDLDQMERAWQRALHHARREAPPPARDEALDGIVGKTPIMQEAFKRIALVAASDACVLLQGESGTGKELAARAIHRYSRRAEGPFVAVNVASLSTSLAESELFGHVKGAFTGADAPRVGLLAQADGGTLFLDEVADIPLPTQVKLLRCLEHGEVLPVGASQPTRTDFRVVSATHQDLPGRARAGSFRHDLYYRLSAFQIDLPPLRERREDIRELAEHFGGLLAARSGGDAPRFSAEALAELSRRPWHGNVRELRNAVEHAIILARHGEILPEHLPPPAAPWPASGESGAAGDLASLDALLRQWAEATLADPARANQIYDQLLALVEPPVLAVALQKHKGQCASAARSLGLHRTTLKKKLDQYGIAGDE